MKTTKQLENLPVTQFYLSCKVLINPALKKRTALAVEKRGTIRVTMSARLDQTRFGRELRRVSKHDLRKVGKVKEKGAAEKEKGEEMLMKGIGKETKRARLEKAKYLANSTARATGTASGETTAGIATRERRGARENLTQLSSSLAKIRKSRKIS